MYNKTQFFGSKTTVDNFNQSYRRVILWKDNFNKFGEFFLELFISMVKNYLCRYGSSIPLTYNSYDSMSHALKAYFN